MVNTLLYSSFALTRLRYLHLVVFDIVTFITYCVILC